MDILELLKTKSNTTRKELLETGVNDYEIHKLVSIGVLIKSERACYRIDANKVKQLLLQKLLEKEEVTRKQLLDCGLSDYEIRKMLKDGKLFSLSRGTFSTKEKTTCQKNTLSSITIKGLQNAIIHKDVSTIIEQIDNISDEDYIPFSKQLLKMLVTELFSGKKDNIQEALPVIDTSRILKESVEDIPKEESTQKKEMTQEVNSSAKENKVLNEKKSFTFNKQQEENLTLEQLWSLYTKNFKRNPIVAKEYLERYEKLCKKEKTPFNYYEYIKVNEMISNLGIPQEQIEEEKNLAKEISKLLKVPHRNCIVGQLKTAIDAYSKVNQNRNFFIKYYQGCYELICENYNRAMSIFKEILEVEPKNILALRQICFVSYAQKKFAETEKNIHCYLEYNPADTKIYSLLASCYIRKSNFSKIPIVTAKVMSEEKTDKKLYLEGLISNLNRVIEKNEEKEYMYPELIKLIVKEVRVLQEILEDSKDLFGQVISDNQEVMDSILEEYDLEEYDDEIYNCLYLEEDNCIHPSNIKTYIENLDISMDEKMLLYLSAAKVLFMNKMPKQAEEYMKLIERTSDKSQTVKKEYSRCRKNKILYLNK